MKTRYAENRIRSANAPAMSAGVITANIIWNAANAMCGTVPRSTIAIPCRPTKSNPPMSPPCEVPNASEYPTATHCTEITASAANECMSVASTFLRRTMPP
jgi:hypothetical protein